MKIKLFFINDEYKKNGLIRTLRAYTPTLSAMWPKGPLRPLVALPDSRREYRLPKMVFVKTPSELLFCFL